MKDLIKNGFLIVLAVALVYVIYLREKRPRIETVTEIVEGPVRVIHDTIYVKIGEPHYIVKTVTGYDTILVNNSNITVYLDSIVNDSIRFWQDILVDGSIYQWNQRYEPIFIMHEITTEQPIYTKITDIRRELYLCGILSGNYDAFSPGVSLDYINKKRNLYCVSVQYLNGRPLYGFRIGARILK